MRSYKLAGTLALLLFSALALEGADAQSKSPTPRFGKPISEADIAPWNIDIRTSDGKGLPSGKGSVAEGKALYAAQCVACHGENAKGGSMYGTMVGGVGSFTTNARVLTPGSMYPYAPILVDYVDVMVRGGGHVMRSCPPAVPGDIDLPGHAPYAGRMTW